MPASASPLGLLGPAPRIILEGLVHRSQLASLELTEARDHAARTALIAILAGVIGLLAGFAALLTLAAIVWDRADRGLILGLATLAFAIGAGALGAWASRRLREWQPLSETRRQLSEDRECLESLFPTEDAP